MRSQPSAMSSRYSSGSRDTHCLTVDDGPQARPEPAARDQIDAAAEERFQVELETHEIVERGALQLDQHVHVAVGPCLAARKRAEDRQRAHAVLPSQPLRFPAQDFQHPLQAHVGHCKPIARGPEVFVMSENPKTVFVTGASSGLGRGLALHYARAGATVHAAARRKDELLRLAAEAPPGSIVPLPLDVTDSAALAAAIEAAGDLDLVIANAGVGRPTT